MPTLHPVVAEVTERLRERSRDTRAAYLRRIDAVDRSGPQRGHLSCGNLAHGFAACGSTDKEALRNGHRANLAIVTAYNDMLSAHQPYERYPALIRQIARDSGFTAQVAAELALGERLLVPIRRLGLAALPCRQLTHVVKRDRPTAMSGRG